MNTRSKKAAGAAVRQPAPLRGHVAIKSGGHEYLVPQVLAASTEQKLLTEALKEKELNKAKEAPGPHKHKDGGFHALASGLVMIPADPPLTEREILGLHAEVKAFQKLYNVSYASAARQLFLVEVGKLEAEQTALSAFRTMRDEIDGPQEGDE